MAEEKIFLQQTSSSEQHFNFKHLLKDLNPQRFEQFLQFLAENNQVESLDISHNHLDDEKFLSILEILCSKPLLKEVDISNNNITDYAIQKMASKLLLQNMVCGTTQFQIIKLIDNPISSLAIKYLSGVSWIRKELKIYVLLAFIPYAVIEKEKVREIFTDGSIFLESDVAYQKAKLIEPHREILLVNVLVPAHAIEFEQAHMVIKQKFKEDLLISSETHISEASIVHGVEVSNNNFTNQFVLKKQNPRIALEYLFRSIKHLEDILEDRLKNLDITQDGKQYLLIHFLLGKNNAEQDILNLYHIKMKISDLKQKQTFEDELLQIGQHLFDVANYIKNSINDADIVLKEFHQFVENILDNLFINADINKNKRRQLKMSVFS